jgi:hypothetical protein
MEQSLKIRKNQDIQNIPLSGILLKALIVKRKVKIENVDMEKTAIVYNKCN